MGRARADQCWDWGCRRPATLVDSVSNVSTADRSPPVKAGARVRNRVELVSAEPKANGNVVVKTKNTLEIEGEDKPALIAEGLVMVMA